MEAPVRSTVAAMDRRARSAAAVTGPRRDRSVAAAIGHRSRSSGPIAIVPRRKPSEARIRTADRHDPLTAIEPVGRAIDRSSSSRINLARSSGRAASIKYGGLRNAARKTASWSIANSSNGRILGLAKKATAAIIAIGREAGAIAIASRPPIAFVAIGTIETTATGFSATIGGEIVTAAIIGIGGVTMVAAIIARGTGGRGQLVRG